MTQPNEEVLREEILKIFDKNTEIRWEKDNPRVAVIALTKDEVGCAKDLADLIANLFTRQCEEMRKEKGEWIDLFRKVSVENDQLTAELEQAKKELERVRSLTVEDVEKEIISVCKSINHAFIGEIFIADNYYAPPNNWTRVPTITLAQAIHALINGKEGK